MHTCFDQRYDIFMQGQQAACGFGFGAVQVNDLFFEVDLSCFYFQQFTDADAAVEHDQYCIYQPDIVVVMTVAVGKRQCQVNALPQAVDLTAGKDAAGR